MTEAARPYESFFAPQSIAVVGASENPAKWGYWLARGALAGEDQRRVFLVNRGTAQVFDHTCVPSLRDLEGSPELVVIAIPASAYEAAVDEALACGTRAIIGITAGIDPQHSRDIAARVRAAGAVLLGPNCLGVADNHATLSLVWGDLPHGPIGLLSQSGNLAIELGRLAGHEGLGISRFASLGNEHDVAAADLLETVAHDPSTQVVALYVEDFSRMHDLATAAERCVEAGTPVALLAAGRSDAARRAAASHTGAMAGSRAAIEATCRAAGIALVDSPAELIDVAHALTARGTLSGRRLGLVGDGGGHGVVAADLAASAGFTVPPLADATQERLLGHLPPMASATNPVDLAGGGEQDHHNYARVVSAVLESGEVDAAVLTGYFGAYGIDEPRLASIEFDVANAITTAVAATNRPTLVHSVAPDSPTCAVLRAGGVPVLRHIEGAIAGLRGIAQVVERSGVPKLPPPAAPASAGDAYIVARALCQQAGVTFPETRFVTDADAAVTAANGVGYPVVVKALGLAHKSDVGGVRLGLADASSVADVVSHMAKDLGTQQFSVESMAAPGGVEVIVGARHEPGCGPLIMVGLGGVLAEVLADVRVELAPVDNARARAMVQSLRAVRLLTGFRGSEPVDVSALADVIVAVSVVLAEHPELAALELNPVRVSPNGCVALDAHLERVAKP